MIERGQLYTVPWSPGLQRPFPEEVVRLVHQIGDISQQIGCVPALRLIDVVRASTRDMQGCPLAFDVVEFYVRVAMALGIIGGIVTRTGENVDLAVTAEQIASLSDA